MPSQPVRTLRVEPALWRRITRAARVEKVSAAEWIRQSCLIRLSIVEIPPKERKR